MVNETLQIRLFGSFEVRVNGEPIEHWPRKDALQLLKLLAMQVSRRIPRAQASQLLWQEDELRPEHRLNNAVYMLRKTLEQQRQRRGHSSFISTEQDTLTFAKGADIWTDVDAFERLLDVGMADAQSTIELAEAIGLYRGPLLFDDGQAPWCLYAREHLKQRYLAALRTLAAREYALGHVDLAIDALQKLVDAHPSEESAHRALIDMLVKAGKHQEARGQYEKCRAALASELGIVPSALTRAAISNVQEALPAGAPGSEGVEEAAAHAPSRDPGAVPPRKKLHPPAVSQPLIGRDEALPQLKEMIVQGGARLLTLSGPGGVGKTQLALHLADQLQPFFADGACFVSLSDVLDWKAVPGIVARAFGVEMDSHKNWEQALADFLQDRHLLVVLDNFEHLLDAAPFVSWMLSMAAGLHIVCTSRSVLKIAAERLFVVPPLELPPPKCREFSALAANPAVRLFVERAQALDASFDFSAANAHDVGALCQRLDGLPLAMELAAARLKLLGLDALLERLQSSFDLLNRGRRDSPDRHRSLDAVLQWSYELLPEDTQAVFRALGMFAGGTTLAHAEAAIDAPGPGSVADAMDQLLDQNLLIVDHGNRSGRKGQERRYRMLQTVRDYALNQLQQHATGAAQQRRFAAYWASVAEHIYKQRTSGEYRQAIQVFDAEFVNFEMAVHWAARNDRALAHQFVATLAAFWGRRGFASEFFAWSRSHLDLTESHEESPWYATACYATGILSFAVGDYRTGKPYIEKALLVSRESGQASQELLALGHLAVLEYVHGRVERAMALNEQAIEFADQSGDTRSSANIVMNLGEMHLTMGNYGKAQDCFNHGLAHKHLLTQSRPSILYFYLYLQARIRGDFEMARAHGHQSVVTGRESRDPRALGWMLVWHAEFHIFMNELGTALHLLEEGEQVNKRVGDAALHGLLGRVKGAYCVMSQDFAPAIGWLERSLDEVIETGFLLDCDSKLLWLLRAHRLAGRTAEANRALRRLVSGEFVLHHYLVPNALEEAAIALNGRNQGERAWALLCAAEQMRAAHGIERTPAERHLSGQALAQLRLQAAAAGWAAQGLRGATTERMMAEVAHAIGPTSPQGWRDLLV